MQCLIGGFFSYLLETNMIGKKWWERCSSKDHIYSVSWFLLRNGAFVNMAFSLVQRALVLKYLT